MVVFQNPDPDPDILDASLPSASLMMARHDRGAR